MYLKQSTASQSVLIGPFVDETDGKTAETGLTIANTDIRLSKNGANMAAKNSGGGTHDEAGWYTMTLDATDTDTVGRLQVSVHVAGALPVWMDFDVLEETVYDALIGSGAAGELAIKLSTQGKADVNAEADTALTDYDAVVPADLPTNFGALAINGSGHVSRVTLVDTTTTNTDMRGTDSAALASVCTEGRLAELDAANLPAGVDAILVDTNELQTDWANGGRLDLILDARASQASVDSLNDLSTGDVDARLAAIGLDHLVSAAVIGTDVADNSIVARMVSSSATADWDTFANTTDSLQAIRDNHPGSFSSLVVDESGAVKVFGFVPGAITATAFASNAITAAKVAADVSTEIWNTDLGFGTAYSLIQNTNSDVNEIRDDTNELQTDLTDGGRLDLLIDAIKAKTDDLPASVFTTAMTEAYRATGATGSIAELLYELVAHLGNSAISGTTKTVNKLDKTAAKTYTLDDDSTPTAIEETT